MKNNNAIKNILKNSINYIVGGLFILYISITTVKASIFTLVNIFMLFIGANIFVDGLNLLIIYLKYYKSIKSLG